MANLPGYEIYGGATITREHDNERSVAHPTGNEFIGLTARRLSDKWFGFMVFKNRVEVPLQSQCTGRGTINSNGRWVATTEDNGSAAGSEFHVGPIPGWVF